MSHKTVAIAAQAIGIDTGKNTLHLIGLDDKGAIVLREKIARGRITARFANVPRCLIGIEAGMATHYVARELSALGHELSWILPDRSLATVLEPDEFAYLDRLELQLSVNGSPRQRDTTKNLVFKPAETISELSTFANVRRGDVLLTGTPSGCALRVPPAPIRRLLQLLPERQFWNLFINAQRRRPQYLQPGDVINAYIRSADGRIDLGEQMTNVLS